jgi:hypothetical protein
MDLHTLKEKIKVKYLSMYLDYREPLFMIIRSPFNQEFLLVMK